MAFFDNDGQPRGAWAFVQGWLVSGTTVISPGTVRLGGFARWRVPGGVICLSICINGCSDYHKSGPEAWWHDVIGGKVAGQRPPPPGADAPFPNLATVPPKPPKPDTASWNQRTAGLITDRIQADQAAALAPIAPVSAPRAPAPTPRSPPAGGESGASAALIAATPPPATDAHAKPQAKSPTAPIIPPATIPTVAPVSSPAEAQRVANGQLPPLPAEPPPRPGIAPPPPRPLVPPTATPPAPLQPIGTVLDFDQGSASLNDPALREVQALAAERGDHGIAITGYGGATSSDPVAQSNALTLGLLRANNLATALVAQGVPYKMLRLSAESAGRGASVRLLE